MKRLIPLFLLIALGISAKIVPIMGKIFHYAWPWLILMQIVCLANFKMVEEGRAVAVFFMGRLYGFLFQWTGHSLRKDFEVVDSELPEEEKYHPPFPLFKLFGSLWIAGFWPLWEIKKYYLEWDSPYFDEVEKKWRVRKRVVPQLDYIYLPSNNYGVEFFSFETKPPEYLPIDGMVVFTGRVRNVKKFLIDAPENPIKEIGIRLAGAIRDEIANLSVEEVIRLKGEALYVEERKETDPLLVKLEKNKIFIDTIKKWGFEIADKGVTLVDVSSPKYADLLAKQKEEEMAKKGRGERYGGTAIETLKAIILGIEEEKLKEFLKENPQLVEKLLEIATDMWQRETDLGKGIIDIRTKGGGGFEEALARMFALWKELKK